MRARIRAWITAKLRTLLKDAALDAAATLSEALNPKIDTALLARNRDLERENRILSQIKLETLRADQSRREAWLQLVDEMAEAAQMAGTGPWRVSPAVIKQTNALVASARASITGVPLREANPISSQGAFGDIELALSNVEWRREINLSWMEFSRWGIQQIILISRLYWVKNPIIRRLIDIGAIYVFGRGFELSSPDPDANKALQEFQKRNKKVLGQVALTKLHQRKFYDGNLFFCFFKDELDKGTLDIRTIDATEIQEIVTNPEDSDDPWYYKRIWTEKGFDPKAGVQAQGEVKTAWYPALGYKPDGVKPDKIGSHEVMWKYPVYHRKTGEVAKWHFAAPPIYPALDWARSAKTYLEATLTLAKAHAQIATDITTKGGQQAIEGFKQQLGTTVGPAGSLWDTNPPGPTGSVLVHGPGTTHSLVQARGKGTDPEEVRRYLLMCCMVRGVPETFLGDVSTGNLATATTLDRPTELAFLMEQEEWREDLAMFGTLALETSVNAQNGMLHEALRKRDVDVLTVQISEAARVKKNDVMVYEVAPVSDEKMEVTVNFPSIREGDIPELIKAAVAAMTLGNAQGEVVGIDEREGVRKLGEYLGIENNDEVVDEQYPSEGPNKYDPLRTKEEEPEPVVPALKPNGAVKPASAAVKAAEGLLRATQLLESTDAQ